MTAVVVRQRQILHRRDGTSIYFEDNAGVVSDTFSCWPRHIVFPRGRGEERRKECAPESQVACLSLSLSFSIRPVGTLCALPYFMIFQRNAFVVLFTSKNGMAKLS